MFKIKRIFFITFASFFILLASLLIFTKFTKIGVSQTNNRLFCAGGTCSPPGSCILKSFCNRTTTLCLEPQCPEGWVPGTGANSCTVSCDLKAGTKTKTGQITCIKKTASCDPIYKCAGGFCYKCYKDNCAPSDYRIDFGDGNKCKAVSGSECKNNNLICY